MRWLLVAFLFLFALTNSVYASILHRNLGNEWVDPAGYGTMKKGTKSKSKGGKGKGYFPPPPPPLPPINQLCFEKLAVIWWGWYLCYYDSFQSASDTCPVQDKRVPAKTTFLFYDQQPQNCSSFKPNERYCQIPADNWIVLQAAGSPYFTDFVSPGNTRDTPEDSIEFLTGFVNDTYKNVTAKVVQQVNSTTNKTTTYEPPPRYETQDLCNLETVDLEGCNSSVNFVDGWFIFSDAYWMRIHPLGPGSHTIEVKNEGYLCQAPGNSCPDPPAPPPYECSGTKYFITAV